MGYICTAVRNGEPADFCESDTVRNSMECYAYWQNMQQFTCPYLRRDGVIEINLMAKNVAKETLQEIARRVFGEQG